jgi:lipid II:glycine glycyltransferase (peptidoglycan interpeptide bridge formation enzyme)
MEILGHSNVQTTMMIYREVTQDAKRQGIAKMDFLTLDPQKLWSTPEFGVSKSPI